MKSVIVSDIHLGKYKYGKVNYETGEDLRTNDVLKNLDESIDFAIKNKVDNFVITGDFYHKKRPFPIFRGYLTTRINRILKEKIEVYLLLGNHDQGKTSGHDLVELSKISSQIERLHIIDTPSHFELKDSIFCFLPCLNKIDYQIETSELEFNLKQIKMLSEIALKSSKQYKLFFGHFGTDKSIAGKSFDLGTVEDQDAKKVRFVPLKNFDPKAWTRVYLGDIHKQQLLNDFCRHVGSIAKVDFGEEFEQKGFYFFEDGEDKFISVNDREFKTLELDLVKEKPRDVMKEECEKFQDLDLSESVVRLKVRIKSTDKSLINFQYLEDYLKEESWYYIGRSVIEITEQKETLSLSLNEELNHVQLFKNYTDKIHKAKLADNVYQKVISEGEKILTEILNS